MMYCHRCGAKYSEGFNKCPDCQISLAPERPVPLSPLPTEELELVTVLKVENLITLSLAEGLLVEAGIEYVTRGQRLYAAGFPINRPVWILVSKEDEMRARNLLENLEVEQELLAEEE